MASAIKPFMKQVGIPKRATFFGMKPPHAARNLQSLLSKTLLLEDFSTIHSTPGRIAQTVMDARIFLRDEERHVPETITAAYLRERAANFRRLAKEHGAAGSVQISAKMSEVALDLEAQAVALDQAEQAA
jgi:hypothetical protein